MKSGCASRESAMVWALRQIIHRGDPMLIGKLKVRRIRYVKLYGMLLQYAFFVKRSM